MLKGGGWLLWKRKYRQSNRILKEDAAGCYGSGNEEKEIKLVENGARGENQVDRSVKTVRGATSPSGKSLISNTGITYLCTTPPPSPQNFNDSQNFDCLYSSVPSHIRNRYVCSDLLAY